ncbi:MAG: EAL domain-containing protein [Alphaproteobacteria bacterium]|nr:EAL domain-containing protein [Alphaproteobacteria bacterium]MBU0803166.1 EAL domain-containing protein [Alphaproteobacteria bacterium]MBU0873854.1 EAL domain-containing protein [Alphaproteobacteria bacterium]MBU1400646.1 EAL domain-containing protein [Alphaproteobacteria bacterium]MBU1590519.1 EAL domain-containing protein [Alphaproteobacteria bacterium]
MQGRDKIPQAKIAQDIAALALATLQCDNKLVITNANSAAAEMFGRSEDELAGRTLDALLEPGCYSGPDCLAVLESGYPQPFLKRDGSSFFGLAFLSANRTGWTVQVADVDDIAVRHESLIKRESTWRHAIEAAGHGVWEVDTRSGSRFYSDSWRRMRGYPVGEDMPDPHESWESRVHPDDIDRVRGFNDHYRAGGSSVVSFEYRERRLDGRWIWISSRGRAVKWDEDGTAVRVLGTDTDITHLKEARQAVEALTQRLEMALKTSGVGIWEVDLDKGTFTCDEALAAIYGFPGKGGAEFPFSTWQQSLHPDDAAGAIEAAHKAMQSGSRLETSFRIVRPDGAVRHVSSVCACTRGADGTAKFLGVDRDITEDREREDELRAKHLLFEGAIYNMAHGLTMFDRDSRLIVCNDLYSEFYGLPPGVAVPGVHVDELLAYMLANGTMPKGQIETATEIVHRLDPSSGAIDQTFHVSTGRIVAFTTTPLAGGGWVSVHRDVTEQHLAKLGLAESEQRFRDFTATASDWCWETDPDHKLTFISQSFKHHTGIDPALLVGNSLFDIEIPDEDSRILKGLFVAPDGSPSKEPFKRVLLHMPAPEGGLFHFRVSGAPKFDADGAFLGFRGTGSDVTAEETGKQHLLEAEAHLKARSEQLVEAQQIGKIGDWSYMLGDTHLWWAPETYALLRRDPATYETRYDDVMADYYEDSLSRLRATQSEVARTGTTKSVDVKARRGDGTIVDFAIISKAIRDKSGALIGFKGTIQDITERKSAEEQLEQLAYFDALTGLPNRARFHLELERAILSNSKAPVNGALLLLDLDRFKEVNDALGHDAGDEMLKKVARLLAAALPENNFLARLGGDEFAVVLPRSTGRKSIEKIAQRINTLLSGSIQLDSGEVSVETSIGIALIPADGRNSTDLMRNADLALYQAKESGRGRFEFFNAGLSDVVRNRLALSQDLRKTVSEGKGLFVHYQPQVQLDTGHVTGFEALLRWDHPERGLVSPTEFIPIAESSHLICDVGLWVLREAVYQAKAWIEAGEPPRQMAVNVSAAQIWRSDFAADVAALLEETGLEPSLLCLELTETLLADHTEGQVRQVLERLNGLGVTLALDDFGTGYSSLGYLRQLPFKKLKIDRIFISGATQSVHARELLSGIIALTRGLNMTAVAEGAELPEEVDMLREMGCDNVQGFAYARPQSADEAIAFVHRHERALLATIPVPRRSRKTRSRSSAA